MSGLLRTVLGRSWLYSQRQVPVNALAIRCVHHHLERDDFERFIGMKRSNPQKANRNTHINEKKWRRISFSYKIKIN
jgi:hypothetical protein